MEGEVNKDNSNKTVFWNQEWQREFTDDILEKIFGEAEIFEEERVSCDELKEEQDGESDDAKL